MLRTFLLYISLHVEKVYFSEYFIEYGTESYSPIMQSKVHYKEMFFFVFFPLVIMKADWKLWLSDTIQHYESFVTLAREKIKMYKLKSRFLSHYPSV